MYRLIGFDMNILNLIGRDMPLFDLDVKIHNEEINKLISKSKFLIIGAAGSIGQAVCQEIFTRNPKCLHAVDLNENNLVELVRGLRSTVGYIDGEFRTFAIDCGSKEFQALMNQVGTYDYVINLSAMKHVRSEKDPFSLMRMIQVNIFNTLQTLNQAKEKKAKKYFCVSTDKAANPVNMMGASKRIMEMFLFRQGEDIEISTARFANVAFSDGSLLHGFNQRLLNRQPISAPSDIRRYFVTPKESGELCLSSILLGGNLETFFPKLSPKFNLINFSDIARNFLELHGFTPYECATEDEARRRVSELVPMKKWPVYFFQTDTSGEKYFEEFYTGSEDLDLQRFNSIGVIKNSVTQNEDVLNHFADKIQKMRMNMNYSRQDLIELFNMTIPNFNHKETGKFLDEKM